MLPLVSFVFIRGYYCHPYNGDLVLVMLMCQYQSDFYWKAFYALLTNSLISQYIYQDPLCLASIHQCYVACNTTVTCCSHAYIINNIIINNNDVLIIHQNNAIRTTMRLGKNDKWKSLANVTALSYTHTDIYIINY